MDEEAPLANTVTVTGLHATVRPAVGDATSESVTLPEKPSWLATVTEKLPGAPESTLKEDVLVDSLKSVTVMVRTTQ